MPRRRDRLNRKILLLVSISFILILIQGIRYKGSLKEANDLFAILTNDLTRIAAPSTTSTADKRETTLSQFMQQSKEVDTPSLQLMMEFLKTHDPPHVHSESITDVQAEQKRCERYGFTYDAKNGRKTRRRIFYGSNIADDSWHAIGSHAAEAYGLYHTMVLVESNVTHMRTPRSLRFAPGSLNDQALKSGIWGPADTTHVFMDHFYDNGQPLDNTGDVYGLLQEDMQRELVLKRWLEQGMTPDDVGIVGDVDEFFSRDFLLAATSCDIPQFRPGQDCRKPKLAGQTMLFESAPDCITKDRYWFHPDMISGQCVHGVGDSTLHPEAKRVMGVGLRLAGYGHNGDDIYNLPKGTKYFPLFKPSDIRMQGGARMVANRGSHSAFHLHNFFVSIEVLRNKYKTYTHGYRGEERLHPLGEFHEDVDLAVRCMMDRKDDHLPFLRRKEGFQSIDGELQPIAFQNEKYRKARFDEIKTEIVEDEKKYGVFDGKYPKS